MAGAYWRGWWIRLKDNGSPFNFQEREAFQEGITAPARMKRWECERGRGPPLNGQ